MTAESFDLDEAYRRKKKAVLVIVALLVILLGGTLLVGLAVGPPGVGTPSPSAVAAITTPPAATATLLPATPTGTSPPTPSATPTPGPTDTARPPSPTIQTPTLTPSPSPTPQSPTPTPSLSPTPPPPTPTATITPAPPRVPVIENPLDGSELPGLALIVQGTADPGATVRVYADEILVGEALADEAGNWSLVPVEQLAAGEQRIVAVDVATGATSTAVTFTLLQAWLPVSGDEGPFPPRGVKTPPGRCP